MQILRQTTCISLAMLCIALAPLDCTESIFFQTLYGAKDMIAQRITTSPLSRIWGNFKRNTTGKKDLTASLDTNTSMTERATTIPYISLQYGRNSLEKGSEIPFSGSHLKFDSSSITAEEQAFLKRFVTFSKKKNPVDMYALTALCALASGDNEGIKASEAGLLSVTVTPGFMGTDLLKKLFGGYYYEVGGYDFAATRLIPLLYLFGRLGENTLPEPVHDHLLDFLLNLDDDAERVLSTTGKGNFALSAPYLSGIVEESENHALMIYSCLFLLYQYHIDLETDAKKYAEKVLPQIEEKLIDYLLYIKTRGFHEFNSLPYIAHSLLPLLNLEAFAKGKVQNEARQLLDMVSYNYALGTIDGKRFAPFCRHESSIQNTSLLACHQIKFMEVWAGRPESDQRSSHRAMAFLLPYRPAKEVLELSQRKTQPYFAKIGHGERGSCEIYWAQPGALLSAGGSKGALADHRVVLRPISLIVEGDATDISETIHLGQHNQCQTTNCSGVYKNFACCAKELYLGNHTPLLEHEGELGSWYLLNPVSDVHVIAYTKDLSNKGSNATPFSLLALFRSKDIAQSPAGYFEQTIANNAENKLEQRFVFPHNSTRIEYDTHSPKNIWVIKSVHDALLGDVEINRNLDNWPLLTLDSP